MDDSLLEEIADFAAAFYRSRDFAHGMVHAKRVRRFADHLQEREGGDPFLVQAGAWLHQFHDHLEMLENGLRQIALSDARRERLREIVFLCRPQRISPEAPLEARLVFDADALDLVGPYGSVRELLCNFSARGLSWEDSAAAARAVQREFLEKLTTAEARRLAGPAAQEAERFWQTYDSWERLSVLGD